MRFSWRMLSASVLTAALATACGSTGNQTTEAAGTTGAGGEITGAGGGHATTSSHAASSSSASASGAGGQGGAVGSGPPYPFVLAHGFFGFEKFAGLDF